MRTTILGNNNAHLHGWMLRHKDCPSSAFATELPGLAHLPRAVLYPALLEEPWQGSVLLKFAITFRRAFEGVHKS
jgi:hypothetical protein